jgi:cbb3-type cytochrome oxidase maturation protein
MDVLFVALPVALLLGAAAVTAFILAARSGQFDDLETPPQRVLYDDVEVKPRSEGPAEQVSKVTEQADLDDRRS